MKKRFCLLALCVCVAVILLSPQPAWALNPFDAAQPVKPVQSNGANLVAGDNASDPMALIMSSASVAVILENRITGAFIQPWGSDNDRSLDSWVEELKLMKDIGMDTVIMQFNQYNGVNFSVATENMLEAADQLGMRVYVGTALNEEGWYVNKILPSFLAKESVSVAKYTTILVEQFAPHKSFVGVYIPYEDNTLSFPGAMGDFYGRIAEAAKAAKPDLKVLISPYTTPRPGYAMSLPKAALKAYFKIMLKRAKVDICAWQDGVGGTRKQLERVAHDLGPIVKVCRDLKIEAWANLEVFHRTTPLSEDFAAEATNIETLKKQMDAEGPQVKKLICFDFNHYFSPLAADPTAHKLYQDYQKHIEAK